MKKPLYKIAVMGPESTGKSAISSFLASWYKTVWVPEYAREYCAALGREPDLEDEKKMLAGQLALEDSLVPSANRLIFCDTMFLTVKIWSEYEFHLYPPEVDMELERRSYDFFLIMNIDLPWENDPLRNFPDLRDHFMQIHLREVSALNIPYSIISGFGAQREQNAVRAVETFMAGKD